jgi:hypothetical protein
MYDKQLAANMASTPGGIISYEIVLYMTVIFHLYKNVMQVHVLDTAAVQVEEQVQMLEVEVVVRVGSSSAPPTQSPLVPPMQWWWGRVEHEGVVLVATLPSALTLPWWLLVGGMAMA